MALLGIFLRCSIRNLNFTKSNKGRTWIYQRHKKKMQIHEVLQCHSTKIKKKKKKKNGLIRDKVKIENAEMRVIMWEGESEMTTE